MTRFVALFALVLFGGLPHNTLFPTQPVQVAQGFGSGAYRPGNGIKPPTLVRQVQPKYTDDARARKVQGDVELEAVIGIDGKVTDVRVLRSLDDGLDANAIAAAKNWIFNPGLDSSGQPVAVVVTLIMSFHVSDQDTFLQGVCTNAPDLVEPTLAWSIEPKYTADALRNKIQGQVIVEAVVDPTGVVQRVRVAQSIDKVYGLDDSALAAAKEFRFQPNSGTCHGAAATTLVKLTLDFRIH
jgi:TonB family protein